jgi:1-acyl-sn-glycerol-3-phosphate acyltransferase
MEVVRVLNLTNRLLTEAPNRAVWIFPQGGIRPNDARPLNFQPGLAQLVRTFKVVRLVPVAFRYEFLWDSKPFAFVSFGKPLIFTSDKKITTRALTAQLESELCSVLDNLRDEVLGGNGLLLDDVMRSKGIFINRLYVKSQWIKWRIAMNTRSLFSHWIESEE